MSLLMYMIQRPYDQFLMIRLSGMVLNARHPTCFPLSSYEYSSTEKKKVTKAKLYNIEFRQLMTALTELCLF